MAFFRDAATSWLQQKKELEALQGTTGPLRPENQQRMEQMGQNVQGGLANHMGQQYLDRIGQRTGLSAFGVGSQQEYKPWEQQQPPQGLLNRVAPPAPGAMLAPGQAMNVDPNAKGVKSNLMRLFGAMYGGG